MIQLLIFTLSKNEFLNPLIPGGNKRSYILKITDTTTWHQGLKLVQRVVITEENNYAVVRNLSFVLEIPYYEFDNFSDKLLFVVWLT